MKIKPITNNVSASVTVLVTVTFKCKDPILKVRISIVIYKTWLNLLCLQIFPNNKIAGFEPVTSGSYMMQYPLNTLLINTTLNRMDTANCYNNDTAVQFNTDMTYS